jgi:hypothetical protein
MKKNKLKQLLKKKKQQLMVYKQKIAIIFAIFL